MYTKLLRSREHKMKSQLGFKPFWSHRHIILCLDITRDHHKEKGNEPNAGIIYLILFHKNEIENISDQKIKLLTML